ncbi:MAG: glutathione S-transferase [Panacagrimonas sp.]|jgi:glutathione S-transferase|nr:glutathione S-transferase family protein [Panacagrimonas sp.]MCC2657243.1 glutathione S-transferase [Panacagrimonas sp.]
MSLILYGHPFSSYCQKVLIPLYENGIEFEFRHLSPDQPRNAAEHARLWPLKRMPLLTDGERVVVESSLIVEYLDIRFPGPVKFIPSDPEAALQVRFLDRFFDQYVMSPMQKVVFDALRAPDIRDPHGVDEARGLLDSAYRWIDGELRGREWAASSGFGLAECAAAPALFYADWVHPIPGSCGDLRAYRRRLLERPSFARAVDEARPFRAFFPLGAPDRD